MTKNPQKWIYLCNDITKKRSGTEHLFLRCPVGDRSESPESSMSRSFQSSFNWHLVYKSAALLQSSAATHRTILYREYPRALVILDASWVCSTPTYHISHCQCVQWTSSERPIYPLRRENMKRRQQYVNSVMRIADVDHHQ